MGGKALLPKRYGYGITAKILLIQSRALLTAHKQTPVSRGFPNTLQTELQAFIRQKLCRAPPLALLRAGNECYLHKVPAPHLFTVCWIQPCCHCAQNTNYLRGKWQRCLIKLNIVFYLHITYRGGFWSTNIKIFLILERGEHNQLFHINQDQNSGAAEACLLLTNQLKEGSLVITYSLIKLHIHISESNELQDTNIPSIKGKLEFQDKHNYYLQQGKSIISFVCRCQGYCSTSTLGGNTQPCVHRQELDWFYEETHLHYMGSNFCWWPVRKRR